MPPELRIPKHFRLPPETVDQITEIAALERLVRLCRSDLPAESG